MSSAEFKHLRIARLPEASQAHSLEPNRTTPIIRRISGDAFLFDAFAGDNDDPSSPMYYLVFSTVNPYTSLPEGAKNSICGRSSRRDQH